MQMIFLVIWPCTAFDMWWGPFQFETTWQLKPNIKSTLSHCRSLLLILNLQFDVDYIDIGRIHSFHKLRSSCIRCSLRWFVYCFFFVLYDLHRIHLPDSHKIYHPYSLRIHRPDSHRIHGWNSNKIHLPDSRIIHHPDSNSIYRPHSHRTPLPDSHRIQLPDSSRFTQNTMSRFTQNVLDYNRICTFQTQWNP